MSAASFFHDVSNRFDFLSADIPVTEVCIQMKWFTVRQHLDKFAVRAIHRFWRHASQSVSTRFDGKHGISVLLKKWQPPKRNIKRFARQTNNYEHVSLYPGPPEVSGDCSVIPWTVPPFAFSR